MSSAPQTQQSPALRTPGLAEKEKADKLPVSGPAPGVKDTPQLQAAIKYAVRGWKVFPCGVDKRPLVKDWPNVATTEPGQIRTWWATWPGASIGCPTGPDMGKPGAWVLDVDLPTEDKTADGRETLATLEAQHGPLPTTVEQTTGGGGRQLFFKWPEGREVRNTAGEHGKLGPGLDVRGAGGYVILPPSGHPSGGFYAWSGNGANLVEAPAWLLDMVVPPSRSKVPRGPLKIVPKRMGTTSYGQGALEDEAARVAGTSLGGRNHALNQAAFAVGQLVAGGELDRVEAEVVLMAAAGQCGLSEGEARKTIESGFRAGEKEPRQAPEPFKADGLGKHTIEACTPIPFDTLTPPPIPPESVPGILREFPEALAEAVQVPFELALCNALGALSVAVQRKFRLKIRDGYFEPLNIYALCPLPPGERKSATVEACKRPLVEWQASKRQELQASIQDAESEHKSLEKAIEAKRGKLAQAATDEARWEIIEEVKKMERSLPVVPTVPRLLADDFTPEAAAVLMAQHEQRIGVLEAEGGIFDTLAGRYSNGVPNLDAVLKFHSGESCQIDRKGRDSIWLDNPHLTMVISPQPEVVKGLAGLPGFRGRGLLGRFFYFIPESRLGSRKAEPSPIPFQLAEAWRQTLHRLLDLPWAVNESGEQTGHVLTLAPAAYALWLEFWEKVECEHLPGGEFENIKDWSGKFPGQAARLAGLFHTATVLEPHRQALPLETMKSALDVAAILAEHAKAAFGLMGSDPAQECAKTLLDKIQREHVTRFTAREALEKVKGRFPRMEKLRPALTLLEERGFIFPIEASRSGAGRPSLVFTVNQLAWRA
jgi:hypothetical protein